MQNHLTLSAFNGPWLIEDTSAESVVPVILQIMQGKTVTPTEGKVPAAAMAVSMASGSGREYHSLEEAPAGSVAIIPLKGVLMRDDSYYFGPGTETLAKWMEAAYNNPNIIAIVKLANTGGGSVDGTETYAKTVENSPKPVVTLVRGMMASAGYWIGSKADYVMLEGKTSIVGSIGTQLNMLDFSKYYASMGLVEHTIRATESKDKNESSQQALKGNYAPIRSEMLDPLNSVFLAEVKAAREGKLDLEKENVLTGKLYVGDAAISAGLADGFGSLEDAIQMALSLAEEADNSNSQPNSNSNNMFGKNKFTALTILAGLTASAITAEQLSAANDELEDKGITGAALIAKADYDALVAKAGQVDQLTQKVTEMETAAATAATEKAALVKRATDAEALAATYGSQPGAKPTNPAATGNELEGDQKETVEADPQAAHFSALGKMFNS